MVPLCYARNAHSDTLARSRILPARELPGAMLSHRTMNILAYINQTGEHKIRILRREAGLEHAPVTHNLLV